jgi:hypothetical protein
MGFEWGFKEFHQLFLKRVPKQHNTPFFDCSVRERKELRSNANRMLNLAAAALERRGIAYFEKECDTEIPVDEPIGEHAKNNPSFSVRVLLKRRNQVIRGDEKYNVQSYSRLESEFFRELNDGPVRQSGDDQEPPGTPNDKQLKTLADRYEELLELSWQYQMLSFDWYILGVFKGFTCAMAWYFLFDDWSRWHDRSMNTGYDRAMRQSVKCDILQGGEAYFAFEMTYYGWYEHD